MIFSSVDVIFLLSTAPDSPAFIPGVPVQTILEVWIMAYKISEECISCGACAAQCPVNAISEGAGKYEIDADTCIECGACADTCPVGAPAQA